MVAFSIAMLVYWRVITWDTSWLVQKSWWGRSRTVTVWDSHFPLGKWRANPGRDWLGVVCTCQRSDGRLYLQRKFPTKSAQSFGSEIYPSSHNHGSGKWWSWKMSLVSKGSIFHFHDCLDKEYVFENKHPYLLAKNKPLDIHLQGNPPCQLSICRSAAMFQGLWCEDLEKPLVFQIPCE